MADKEKRIEKELKGIKKMKGEDVKYALMGAGFAGLGAGMGALADTPVPVVGGATIGTITTGSSVADYLRLRKKEKELKAELKKIKDKKEKLLKKVV